MDEEDTDAWTESIYLLLFYLGIRTVSQSNGRKAHHENIDTQSKR